MVHFSLRKIQYQEQNLRLHHEDGTSTAASSLADNGRPQNHPLRPPPPSCWPNPTSAANQENLSKFGLTHRYPSKFQPTILSSEPQTRQLRKCRKDTPPPCKSCCVCSQHILVKWRP